MAYPALAPHLCCLWHGGRLQARRPPLPSSSSSSSSSQNSVNKLMLISCGGRVRPFGNCRARSGRIMKLGKAFTASNFVGAWRGRRRNGGFSHGRVWIVVASAFELGKGSIIATESLPPAIRKRTMTAIDELGGRVTVGDVASRAGLKISQAENALQALASDVRGFLEVSNEGDVLYVFPKEYRSNLAAKSLRIRIEPFLTKLKAAADYLIRVSFGTALLTSILLVYTTIMVLLTSTRSEDDNRGGRGGYSSNQRARNPGFSLYISPSDLLWYWDPYYYRRRRSRQGGFNFFESVFSFVFGDGDPNEGSEEMRWKMIGEYITSRDGVVCAEELAPFLDVQATDNNKTSRSSMDDESYVLPVLLKFDGQPEVDNKGNILYRFPSLQRTASSLIRQRKIGNPLYFTEQPWIFSKAPKTDQSLVIALGGVNLLGVLFLSSLLKDVSLVGQFGSGLVPLVAKLLPALQVYTASFFAIPIVRWLLIQKRNSSIDIRNAARKMWASLLERPDAQIKQKLASAEDMAKKVVIGQDQIIYTTEKDLAEQDFEAQEWDRKLREHESWYP